MLTVPTERPIRLTQGPTVPPAGLHEAVVTAAAEEGAGVRLTLRFRAEERHWQIEHVAGAAETGQLLLAWGHTPGEQIEAGALVGRHATIAVATFGGRKRAVVERVDATA